MAILALTASASNFMVDGFAYNYLNGSSGSEVEVTYTNSNNNYANNYSGLTTVNIPSSVTYSGKTYSVTSIGNYAFRGCRGLTSVTIPNSVTSIGSSAFSYCSGLTSVTIPNSVTSIGYEAFNGTPWFNNQPDGLVYAGLVAYKYKGTMPANTLITLRDGTKGIAGGAFMGCSDLTSITIPNSVTSIGGSAFRGCSGLTSVTIPNSVTSIAYEAFCDCSGLTSVTIPNSVTSINYRAFYQCSGLTEIRSKIVNVSDVSMRSDVFYNVPTSTCTLKVPIGTATAYRNANQWKDFSNINDVLLIASDTVGDLNFDNAVSGEDINIMVNYLLHKSVYIDDDGVADIDGDGKPTGFDLNRIVRIILGE